MCVFKTHSLAQPSCAPLGLEGSMEEMSFGSLGRAWPRSGDFRMEETLDVAQNVGC